MEAFIKKEEHGYIEPSYRETDYVFGQQKVPELILAPDGQWDKYLPKEEFQALFGIDPANCTGFATNNCFEILGRAQFEREDNHSDRFTGVMAGTFPPGNSPVTVIDSVRKNGLVPEVDFPFTEELFFNVPANAPSDWFYKQYYSVPPISTILKARKFLNEYEIKYERVGGWFGEVNKNDMMKTLKYSPLGVAVFAWAFDGEYYYRPEGYKDTHWTVIYGYEEGKYWKCFDSYPDGGTVLKKIKWDTPFYTVLRYSIGKKLTPEQYAYFMYWINYIREAIKRLGKLGWKK